MSLGYQLITIIGIALVVLMIWNLISLKELKEKSIIDRSLSDPRYYELKYKQEFFVATVSLVATVLVIFGYNSLQNVERALKDDFVQKTKLASVRTDSIFNFFDSSINSRISSTEKHLEEISSTSSVLMKGTETKLKEAQETVGNYTLKLNILSKKQRDLEKRNLESDQLLNGYSKRIEDLNSKNILKQNFYIVDGLTYDTRVYDTLKNQESAYKVYYFKNMYTTVGDRLPIFRVPPYLVCTIENSINGATGNVKEITTESFKFTYSSWSDTNRITKFSIFVSDKIK